MRGRVPGGRIRRRELELSQDLPSRTLVFRCLALASTRLVGGEWRRCRRLLQEWGQTEVGGGLLKRKFAGVILGRLWCPGVGPWLG